MVVPGILIWISSLSFIAAAYYAIKLGRQSRGEDLWILLLIVVLAFGVMHFTAKIPSEWNLFSEKTRHLIIEVAEIIGEITLAYTIYCLYKAMKKIRLKMQER